MNESFHQLIPEKKNKIINAGYKVFASSRYQKAPVSEIAAEAGISKSLLFYYFKNKKELYVYLWRSSVDIVKERLAQSDAMDTDDLFEMLRRSLRVKCEIMRQHPHLMEFQAKAYYETDLEITGMIRTEFQALNTASEKHIIEKMNKEGFPEDMDFHYMYQEMMWASDGFLRKFYHEGIMKPEIIDREYDRLISFWGKVYKRRE